jgi:hypothetical protein
MKKYIMNSLGHISEIDEKPKTAYELANELLNWTEHNDAAYMLRQQADRITELERFIKDRGETCAFIVWSNTRGKE